MEGKLNKLTYIQVIFMISNMYWKIMEKWEKIIIH